MLKNLLKSMLHNTGAVIVGMLIAYVCTAIDTALEITGFKSITSLIAGWIMMAMGFLLRVWATFYFYEFKMRVISLHAQMALLTDGPYGFSRNPLYLGGNVFIFFGAMLAFGTPSGIFLTALHIPAMELMIHREEKQLESRFGNEWLAYKKRVPRWI